MDVTPHPPKEVLKRAPTLYAITMFKLLKGTVFVIVALIIYAHSDNDLPSEYKNLLEHLHHWLRLNPERKFWTELAVSVDNLTESRMVHFAIGTFIYSTLALIEGFGLMFRASWAGWMAIIESAFFIPIEILELMHHSTWVVYSILIVNVFIVWYLFKNRARLFHHHFQPEVTP
jgi:uncharacterized membrane protein (DUF2068 family)